MIRPPMLPGKAAQALVIAAAMIAVTGSGTAFAGAAHAQRAPAETAQKSAQASAERTGPLLNGDRVSIVAGPSGQPTVAILGTAPGPAARCSTSASARAATRSRLTRSPTWGGVWIRVCSTWPT